MTIDGQAVTSPGTLKVINVVLKPSPYTPVVTAAMGDPP
jgi:hypothetical protein